MKHSRLAFVFVSTLFASCTIHPQRGNYLGSDAPGWKQSYPSGSGGLTSYEPTLRSLKHLEITFSCSEKGHVYAHIGYLEEKPELDGTVSVTFPNSGTKLEFPARKLIDGLDIPVGEAQTFTIVIPGFTAKGVKLPELATGFTWSDKTYYYIRGIQ